MVFTRRLYVFVALGVLAATPVQAKRYHVDTQAEFQKVSKSVGAGDVIILANRTWRDFEIRLSGAGTKRRPIKLTAQDPGKVILSGQSNLRIGGTYIEVSGLVFKGGYSPDSEVISFRRSKQDLAHNSRITNIVIEDYSKPSRLGRDYWVGMYGKNNRFDHNHLAGKTNAGVTLAVRLDTRESQKNNHRIDHNYFGHRPVLGSNGGETLRIGTSKYSMFESRTLVEKNYFERCDGEIEIISSKSRANTYRGNVFYESQGTLTLRHGDGNVVEGNVFFGNGKERTGGIRVINRNQSVRGNYLEGLRGRGFASALTVMNGVPQSPLNRYVQVSGAVIEHNTVVDSSAVTLGAGSDAERSLAPVESSIAHNIFMSDTPQDFLAIKDDIGGIAFRHNVTDSEAIAAAAPGIKALPIQMKRAANGLLYPKNKRHAAYGAPKALDPVKRKQTGVPWYPKPRQIAVLDK